MIPFNDPVPFDGFKMSGGSKPSLTQAIHASEIVIAQSSLSHTLKIIKNKWGEMGDDIDIEKFSYIAGRMIAQKFFSGLHNMFQEGMAQDIQEAITKIVKKYQPKAKKGKKFYDRF